MTMSDSPPPVLNRYVWLFSIAAILAVFFPIWTWLALGDGKLFAFDHACAAYWKEHGVGWEWDLMVLLTDLGGVATMAMVAIMGALWQFSLRNRGFGRAWFAIVVGGAMANQMLKIPIDRERHEEFLRDRAVLERNQSYPSGHSMGSVIGYGMLCYVLLRQARFPLRRTVILMFFVVFVLGIGFSRIYLRAHWFSDVIGGWVAGLCWLTFWLGWLERRRLRFAQAEKVLAVKEADVSEPVPVHSRLAGP